MLSERRLSAAQKRIAWAIALVAIVGLLVCSTLFFASNSTRKHVEASAPVAQPETAQVEVKTDKSGETSVAVAPEIFIDHAQIQIEEQQKQEVRKAPKRNSLRSRKLVASKFPAPPVAVHNSYPPPPLPGSEVEMWQGDKRTFISVPPGSKFEE